MNPSDVQSEIEPTYFDPEEIDMSEQQFAASLEISAAKPQFEIDEIEGQCGEVRQASASGNRAVDISAETPEGHVVSARGSEGSENAEVADSNFVPPAEAQLDWRN